MMTRLKRLLRLTSAWLPLALLLGLSGCASQYSVSQREVEQYLNREIHFEVTEGSGPIKVDIRLNDIRVTLGHKPDTMAVTAMTRLSLHTPLFPLRASLSASFEAKPWYDSQSHGVYLRDLNLVGVESSPKDLGQALSRATPQLMSFLRHYLETQPVYVLDTKDSNQALMAKMAKSLEVQPGKLVLQLK
ncbi:DUF1439 domain-containing protein [Shewanella sp. AS16]|uniref:DUF1439 domain-containing protein n=1 Tax=Shewanella sp. AS16 TaxID=2907625 RepID=UPI001F48D31A|nr:DUF1439 domain-containing protein [Shewanella sp. AS16]MCE9686058.1 DUF1439 domain-containing protein [Shewanella sp. AS16]